MCILIILPTHSRWHKLRRKTDSHLTVCVCVWREGCVWWVGGCEVELMIVLCKVQLSVGDLAGAAHLPVDNAGVMRIEISLGPTWIRLA